MPIIHNRVFRFLFTVGCLILLVSLLGSVIDVFNKRGIVNEHELALEAVKRENDRLKRELDHAQTPEFVEKEVRNKLGLVREGEVIVLIDTAQPSIGTLPSSDQAAKTDQEIPTWKQWWMLFF